MNSDKHYYEIFETCPEWFFELTQRRTPGPCRFVSLTLKAIERRADGVLLPEDPAEPITITEWQMHRDHSVYCRMVIEMALIQDEHAGRTVEGIVIFGTKDFDPQTNPWNRVVTCYYLDELIEQLAVKSPSHPIVAVFQPLIEKDEKFLEKNVAKYYNQIRSTVLDERSKSKLLSVFVDWVMQRFHNLGKQELEEMLMGALPDLVDTQAGKDLIAIGVHQGIEKGLERGIEKGIAKGIEKGVELGIEQGELIGRIQTCQLVLKLSSTSEKELRAKSVAELRELARILQDQLADRFDLK